MCNSCENPNIESSGSDQAQISTYTVTGMTCGHCVASVTEEITDLPGVTNVSVDLPTGEVTVTSEAPIQRQDVKSAVEEAGYQLV